jgi:hypothetical protein
VIARRFPAVEALLVCVGGAPPVLNAPVPVLNTIRDRRPIKPDA